MTIIYCDADAPGGGNGSLSEPFNTTTAINQAAMVAGDVVELNGKTYSEQLTITQGGARGNHIEWRNGVFDGGGVRDYAVRNDSAEFVSLQGLTGENCTTVAATFSQGTASNNPEGFYCSQCVANGGRIGFKTTSTDYIFAGCDTDGNHTNDAVNIGEGAAGTAAGRIEWCNLVGHGGANASDTIQIVGSGGNLIRGKHVVRNNTLTKNGSDKQVLMVGLMDTTADILVEWNTINRGGDGIAVHTAGAGETHGTLLARYNDIVYSGASTSASVAFALDESNSDSDLRVNLYWNRIAGAYYGVRTNDYGITYIHDNIIKDCLDRGLYLSANASNGEILDVRRNVFIDNANHIWHFGNETTFELVDNIYVDVLPSTFNARVNNSSYTSFATMQSMESVDVNGYAQTSAFDEAIKTALWGIHGQHGRRFSRRFR